MDVVPLVVLAGLGAALQRSVGAGYSVLLLPAALLALRDDEAVSCVLGAGVVLGALLLATGGRPASLGRARIVLLAAPVGQVAASVFLGALRGPDLRLVTAALLAAGVLLAWRPLPTPPPVLAVVAGALIGAVAALSGVIGPFLAVTLVALRDANPPETRRRLWLGVTLLCATGLLSVLATGTGSRTGALYGLALAPALAAGVLLGRRLDRLLSDRHRFPAVLLVALAGAAILAAGAA